MVEEEVDKINKNSPSGLGLIDYGKIIMTIILVNIEITITQTIIFEFENMIYLFSMSLPKITL